MIKTFKIASILTLMLLALHFLVQTGDQFHVPKKTKVSAFSDRPNNGQFKLFYPNGHIRAIEHYSYGKRNGTWEYYHPNGKISKSVPYDHDSIQGSVYHFSNEGVPVYTEIYENNTLVDRLVDSDSLYRLTVVLPNRGKELHMSKCNTCHEAGNAFAEKLQTDRTIDSTINMADLHAVLQQDSIWSSSYLEVLAKNDTLSHSDLDALDLYLNHCQEEIDIMTYTTPTRKVSNTVDRRKLSYLDSK